MSVEIKFGMLIVDNTQYWELPDRFWEYVERIETKYLVAPSHTYLCSATPTRWCERLRHDCVWRDPDMQYDDLPEDVREIVDNIECGYYDDHNDYGVYYEASGLEDIELDPYDYGQDVDQEGLEYAEIEDLALDEAREFHQGNHVF